MIHYTQVSSEDEIFQIKALQQNNLAKNIAVEEAAEQGFVTVEHTLEELKLLNSEHPHTIAKIDTEVVGYALSMHPKFKNEIAILKPMFIEIEKYFPDANYMAMGQICIAKAHRGKGIFRGLYNAMKQFLPKGLACIITEVDYRNSRSMKAHKAIGFVEIAKYIADDKEWSLIALK
ncbi:GNAT family N-acetyltransferase [Croceivirga radicis]|uniref:GNAT family N-acetyltransferase n=1 Tax=Croceivirga radicis TaxID=1929488 RepID=A0A1V6LWL7_9FLAO|nr:GNAT family N-acetyltransferase [Croceivirga radicis]OQD44447.1 GNAT family N-acetyltransferase [Croceivirga radicis]